MTTINPNEGELSDAEIDVIFDMHQAAPTMTFRYWVAREVIKADRERRGAEPVAWLTNLQCEPISDVLKRAFPAFYEHHTVPLYLSPTAGAPKLPDRDQFEAWAARQIGVSGELLRNRIGGVYMDNGLNLMWTGWQACAEAGDQRHG